MPFCRSQLRCMLVGGSLLGELGVTAFLVADSLARAESYPTRWLVAAPLVAYALVAVPRCAFRPSATWRGALHACAAAYAAAAIAGLWLALALMCVVPEYEEAYAIDWLADFSELLSFVQRATTLCGTFLFVLAVRIFFECADARMEAADRELTLLEEAASLDADATVVAAPLGTCRPQTPGLSARRYRRVGETRAAARPLGRRRDVEEEEASDDNTIPLQDVRSFSTRD